MSRRALLKNKNAPKEAHKRIQKVHTKWRVSALLRPKRAKATEKKYSARLLETNNVRTRAQNQSVRMVKAFAQELTQLRTHKSN
jgi:hypothetical protein